MKKYSNLKIRYKILLLSFVILLPFVSVSFFLFLKFKATGPSFIQERITVVSYIQELLALEKIVQERRGMTAGLLEGDPSFVPLIAANRKELEALIIRADRIMASWPEGYEESLAGWMSLRDKTVAAADAEYKSIDAAYNDYTGVVEEILFEIRKNGEGARLNDAELSGFLVEYAIRDIPAAAEDFGNIRFLSTAIAASGKIGGKEQNELAAYFEKNRIFLEENERLISYLSAKDAAFMVQGEKAFREMKAANLARLDYLKSRIIKARVISVSSAETFTIVSEAINSMYKLNHLLVTHIHNRLDEQYMNAVLRFNIVLGGAFFFLFLFLLLARYISRSITYPLENAVNLARIISAGDLRQEIESVETSETGLLLNSMNTMRLEIHNIIGQLLLTVQKMNLIAESMKTDATGYSDNAKIMVNFAEETALSAVEMISSVDNVASYTKSQTDNADKINVMVTNLSQAMTEITEAMKELESLAIQSREDARQGESSINEATEAIAEVNSISKEIKGIIGIITDIARQTNLLALNAAIEAARAGEAGMGFAVVADEISKLSARTAASVQNIGELIQRSNEAADDTSRKVSGIVEVLSRQITAMEKIGKFTQKVMSDLEVQNLNAGESALRVSELASIIREINEASGKQLNSLQEISISLQSVSDQTKLISDGAEHISDTSEHLGTIITILKKSINNFKINEGALITWNESFLVGIPEMDKQHKKLFDILQGIYNCLQDKGCISDIGKLIGELSEYASVHLREEEKLLEDIGYPDLEEHRLMHVKMEAKIVEFGRMYEKEGDLVVYDILQFVANWLIFHIKEEDHKYSEYFATIRK